MPAISDELTKRYTITEATNIQSTIEVGKATDENGLHFAFIDVQTKVINGLYPNNKDRYIPLRDARISVFMSQIPALIIELEKIFAASEALNSD